MEETRPQGWPAGLPTVEQFVERYLRLARQIRGHADTVLGRYREGFHRIQRGVKFSDFDDSNLIGEGLKLQEAWTTFDDERMQFEHDMSYLAAEEWLSLAKSIEVVSAESKTQAALIAIAEICRVNDAIRGKRESRKGSRRSALDAEQKRLSFWEKDLERRVAKSRLKMKVT